MSDLFTAADLASMARLGIDPAEAARHVAFLTHPPAAARLERPCTRGDGVERMAEEHHRDLLGLFEEAEKAGRLSKFVPASGAASRMFQSLRKALDDSGATWFDWNDRASKGDHAASEVVRFVEELESLPFAAELREAVGEEVFGDPRGHLSELLAATLLLPGLGLAGRPKGLVPFHLEEEGSRTPFEEHLVEAGLTVRAESGRTPVHFTVAEEARGDFEALLERHRSLLEKRLHARFEVTFSVQERSSDTLAVGLDGRPFRTVEGDLLFRPGGHGALLGNLAALGGDIVFVKNIDNVVPDARKGPTLLWKRILAGRLLEVERRVHHLVSLLSGGDPAAADEALSYLRETFGDATAESDDLPPDERVVWVRARLERPLRVCGVVRNQGEPGGGPFWVRGRDGRLSRQIVESAEVDLADPAQKALWAAGTHFNPVDLVLSLRDASGRPWDLSRFVDEEAVFVSKKSHGGVALLALERPGLWNGAMAFWNTLFVEVPIETFAPVKSVLDLLRPEHRPAPE
ncbi:MAG: DUF4301 family protein [Holophagales bacterium]|nr:DUF4301 family protein [Holophagales bacterium]